MLKCPNCDSLLTKQENSYVCSHNHHFDISRSGYVNLLLPHETKRNSGDNKQMVNARINLMNDGYYKPLGMLLQALLASFIKPNDIVIDCGCGPGYFTNHLKQSFPNTHVYGMDISKCAIDYAAKTYKQIDFVVASCAHLPFMNESVPVLINIFAPHFEEEFYRVLVHDGWLVKVIPNTNHLQQLKTLLYEEPVFTNPKELKQDFWNVYSEIPFTYDIDMNQEQLENLLKMTPYYYTTSPQDLHKVKQIEHITLTMDFMIYLIKKSY
jgi:23S rRNA (guanine745-N1)-methyltransferase